MAVIRGAGDWSPQGRDERERENEEALRMAEMKAVAEHDCFYCLGPLSYPAVYWSGASELLLHPGCARGLVAALLRDAREAGPP